MNFGGCSLPAATPRNSPMPIFWHSARSDTQHVDGDGLRAEVARTAQPARRRATHGLERQVRALAEADHDDTAGGNAAGGVQMRDVRGLGPEALGLENVGHLPVERAVDARGDVAQLALLRVHTDDDRVGPARLERSRNNVDLHDAPPAARAAARRIMSMSPSVVSSRSTSSIGTQRTSAASSPAVIVSSSDSGKAR